MEAIVSSDVEGEFDGGTVTAPDGSVYSVINQSNPAYPLDQFVPASGRNRPEASAPSWRMP